MAVKTSKPKTTRPLLPPDESLWEKYSPHYELPLAGATSLFLHGMFMGVMAIAGMAFFWAAREEAAKPPKMDVVMIEGSGSGGLEGGGGEAGLPGAPDAGRPKRTEQVTPFDQPNQPDPSPPRLIKPQQLDLGMPLIDDPSAPLNSALSVELANLVKDAEDQANKKVAPPTGDPGPGKKLGPVGTGNPKGKGGLGGSGDGTGMGNKKGAGTGKGGMGGTATKQEVYSWRWAFDPSGNGGEHARKLAAMGVTIVVPHPKLGLRFITDLNRRPAVLEPGLLPNLKEVVRWENNKPDSVQALARELQLTFTPTSVLLLLPKDQEEKMAAEEARFAKQQRRDLRNVRKTWFDFRLKNGSYEPVGVRFE